LGDGPADKSPDDATIADSQCPEQLVQAEREASDHVAEIDLLAATVHPRLGIRSELRHRELTRASGRKLTKGWRRG